MGRIAVVWGVLTLCCGSVQASDWTILAGKEITDALSERTLRYEAAMQVFYASGRTLYDAGTESWGYWQVRGDQYCSQWPPSGLWDCYDVARQGDTIRFVGSDGSFSDGAYDD